VRLLALWLSIPAAALTAAPARAAPDRKLPSPVASACISSPFGPRTLTDRPKADGFHQGIDLPAPLGAPVRAVAAGAIMRVQRRGAGGLEMLVRHDGFIGVYSHLGLIAPTILNGSRIVSTGQQLGTVGRSGLTYGPHLYFGMLVNGRAIDPAPYLGLPSCDTGSQAPGVTPKVSPKPAAVP
jgi:murein DD-endopeptidase MepM/ murein hydrolase activator NlpD